MDHLERHRPLGMLLLGLVDDPIPPSPSFRTRRKSPMKFFPRSRDVGDGGGASASSAEPVSVAPGSSMLTRGLQMADDPSESPQTTAAR